MSPTAPEAPGLPSADSGAKHTNRPGSSEGREITGGVHTTPGGSPIKHDAYFFKDGNVTFLVDGTLYCVHRYFFSRDSVYFSTRFSQLDIQDHEALPTVIPIDELERKDFEALLSVLYPANFGAYELTYEQWRSVLHLSTHWGFTSLREFALKSITPTPHDQLVLARTYSIDHWVLPALTALCERSFPLSLDEARQMSMGDVVLVARVREEIRGSTLRVGAADIRRHIEVAQAQAEQLNHTVGDDVQRDAPKNEAPTQKSDSTVAPGIDPNAGAKITETVGVTSPSEPQRAGTKEGDTHEGDAKHSSKEEAPPESQGEDARRNVEQPHVVEGTPQYLEKSVATSDMQASGTRKSEDASREAAACPSSQVGAVLVENHARETVSRLDVEAEAESVRRLVGLEAEAAKERAKAEEKARKEAARAKEEADAEAKRTAMEAEAKVKREAEAKARAEAAAKAKLKAEAEDRELVEALRAEIEAMVEAAVEAEKAKADARRAKIEADVRAMVDAEARGETAAETMAKEARDRKPTLLSPVTDAWGKIIKCENCSNHAVGALHYCSQRYMKCDRCRRGRERFEFFRECDTCPGTPVEEDSETGKFAYKSDYFY
ncbi:hypothetical protein EDB83DRAFT_1360523 [Lactarius deliciosus]|nr:hypothetical protein EDB83DRAFT_1360523 [Lactarius deliciosus]